MAEHGGGEGVHVKRRRNEPHLGVAEVEYQMLPLVGDAVVLEPEEVAEPIHEVVGSVPRHEGGFPEVGGGAEGGGGGAYLGVTEGGVVVEEVVDGDDVERFSGGRWGVRAALGARDCGALT